MDVANLVQALSAAFRARERKRTAGLMAELIAAQPPLGDDWWAIARMAATMCETSLACAAARLYAKAHPNDIERLLNVAGLLSQMGQVEEGLALIEPLANKNPNAPQLQHFVGMVKTQLGDKEGALKSLRQALKIWPQSGNSWLMLSTMKKFTKDDADFTKMESLASEMEGAQISAKEPYYYALGKAWLDVDDLDKAMAAFSMGGALIKKERPPYGYEGDRQIVEGTIGDYGIENLAKLQKGCVGETRPIFIIGMPRSGTTLLEQILTAHPDVKDGAELNYITNATMEMGGLSLAHAKAYEQKQGVNAWVDIGKTYLHLLESRFGAKGRIVDKSLNNSRYLGLIGHIFPDAPLIWIRRKPEDIAWSCFRTFFTTGMSWTCDFADIAKYIMLEDQLFQHWTKVYPEKILVVEYENLVSNPDLWFDKILNHVGLEPNAGVKDFHQNKRVVYTASVGQVREPIHRKSVGSAEKLGDYLKPFSDNYKNLLQGG